MSDVIAKIGDGLESGMVTINTERRCRRKTMLTTVTTIVSSISARLSVETARSMSADRS